MARRIIVLLSGEIAAGKSTLAKTLEKQFGFKRCSTRELLQLHASGKQDNREALQRLGRRLDKKTNGSWLVDGFQELYPALFDGE